MTKAVIHIVETAIENPGSPLATKLGCTCDPTTNRNGEGIPINGGANSRFVIRLYCPVHSAFQIPEKTT